MKIRTTIQAFANSTASIAGVAVVFDAQGQAELPEDHPQLQAVREQCSRIPGLMCSAPAPVAPAFVPVVPDIVPPPSGGKGGKKHGKKQGEPAHPDDDQDDEPPPSQV